MSRKKSSFNEKKLRDIGLRIWYIRKYFKLNQAEFGKSIGISGNYVSNLEKGKYEPSQPILLAIKSRYSIDPDLILSEDDFPTDKINRLLLDKLTTTFVHQSKPEIYIEDLLNDARKILTSGNQAAIDALERNIRYFSHAIDVENRLMEIENRLAAVEKRGIGSIKVGSTNPGLVRDAGEEEET